MKTPCSFAIKKLLPGRAVTGNYLYVSEGAAGGARIKIAMFG
jgi:hypothetical protein